MFVLEAKIEIGDYVFQNVHEVEITKSSESISDSAIIKLPANFKVRQSGKQVYTEEAIQAGDKVSITLGYEGKYSGVEFVGYVSKISPKTPVEIHCMDAIWHLRRKTINKSFGKTTIKDILREVVKDTPVELSDAINDIPVDKWIIKKANGAQVLDSFKSEFGLSSFIDDTGKLYCGLQQLTNVGEEVLYDLNYNIVENNLEYIGKNDRRIKVKFNYLSGSNKKTSVEVGDADGEEREFNTSVVSDKSTLEKMALAELEKLKVDGFSGDVTSFLIPYATRGMKAVIIDEEHPNREGSYYIKKVVTTFGTNGARRKVSIGNKL